MGADGSVQLTVRYGSRVLEFAKGMDAVELARMNWLVCWSSLRQLLSEVRWMIW